MGYEEEKQRQLDLRYLRMARIWAENSYCVRRKVGALIVKDKMIISDGYNGTPSGFENICEDESGKTKSYVLHAEANAITKERKQLRRLDPLHNRRPLHRVFETDHSGRHPTCGICQRLPFGRGSRPAAPRRHRVRQTHSGPIAVQDLYQCMTIQAGASDSCLFHFTRTGSCAFPRFIQPIINLRPIRHNRRQ